MELGLSICGLIIISYIAAVLFGRFAKVGAGPDAPSPADELDALIAAQPAKEDAWIAELEEAIHVQRNTLSMLLAAPFPITAENIEACRQCVVSIGGAERVLKLLYARRGYGQGETAASYLEGRM